MTTTSKKEKTFDAVQMMREARDVITRETEGMTFAELEEYIQAKLRQSDVMPVGKEKEFPEEESK